MYGTVVVDGYKYWITTLRLRGNHIVFQASRHGPVRPITDEPAAVFGEDGLGICQSWLTTLTPAEAASDYITIEFRIRIDHMETVT
jgi:hypothetical protein